MKKYLFFLVCLFSICIQAQNDIDTRIGVNEQNDPNMFVLVISNENYKYEQSVPYALNDGNIFKLYCEKTLGIPQKNIHYVGDATLNDMRMELMWLEKVMKAYSGEARAIIYYSGHGMPSEDGKHAYLLPVDGNSQLSGSGLSTQQLYKQLGAMPSAGTIVLLDACFSGAQRDGKMLSSSRGVAIKAKEEPVSGNLVVFSAAQGDETAYPYKEYHHGLFTFFLLSALQEKGGLISLGDLYDYVTKQVSRTSIVENGKSQTPSITASLSSPDWRSWMFARVAAKKYETITSMKQPNENKNVDYSSVNTKPTNTQPTKSSSTSSSEGVNRKIFNFGSIKSEEIIKAMPEYENARKQLEYIKTQVEREKFQQEKMKTITSKVKDAITHLGQQYNCLYVFEENAGVAINPIYFNDLTQLVEYQMGLGGSNVFNSINEVPSRIGYIDMQDVLPLLNRTTYTKETDSIKVMENRNRIKKAMEVVAIKNSIAFIVEKGSGIPFANPILLIDATPLVKFELNLGGYSSITFDRTIDNAKFGHIDSREIITAMPEYWKAKSEIEALVIQYESELKRMQDDLEQKGEAYEREESILSNRIRQQRQQELQALYQHIQETYQNNQLALAKSQQEKMLMITNKVIEACKEVGLTGNYAFIMEMEGCIPYISSEHSIDVTKQVKERLGL